MQPIGREADVAAVLTRVAAAAEGSGSIVLIEGEAGAGKSMLLDAAVRGARERGAVVLTSRSWALSTSVPYESFVAAVSRHLRSLPHRERSELTAGLRTLGALIDGLDLDPPDVAPEAFKARAHDALAALVRRMATGAPVVLVFDDFHWFDQASLEVLQYLCVDLAEDRVVIVLAMRTDEVAARAELRQFVSAVRRSVPATQITVGRLDREQVGAVLRARLDGAVAPRLVELVHERSGGTPLFVHELVDDLLDRAAIAANDGMWQLVAADAPLPPSVRDAIRDRLDRIDARDRAVLEALAVVNDVTTASFAAELTRADVADVEAALGRLAQHRLATGVQDASAGGGWAVEHPLIAEVVEAELLPAARRRLHRQVLDADPGAPVGRRARHAMVSTEQPDRATAVPLLVDAGAHALAGGAPSAAIEPLRVALEWLAPDDATGLRDRIERDLGTAYVRRLEPRAALIHLRSAWARAAGADDAVSMVELLPLIDDAEFLLGSEGLGSIDIEPLQARLTARGEWELLADLALLRFARGGRSLDEAEIEAALAAVRSIPSAERTGRVGAAFDVLARCAESAGVPDRSCSESVAGMLARAEELVAWPELHLRFLLVTLDVASQSGDPQLVAAVAEPLAEAERRTGRRPNWRMPIIQALHSTAAGRLDEATIDHDVLSRGGRRHPVTSLVDALVVRAVEGPAAALAAFERAVPETSGDRTIVLYRSIGRLLLGIGTPDEAGAAEVVVGAVERAPIGVVTRLMMSGAGAQLARALAGGADAGAAIDELDVLGGGTALPSAWAELARARRATEPADRCSAFLRSADVLDRLGRHLDAAERVLDAAECVPSAVPPERLALAADTVAAAGAAWLAGRAGTLVPVRTARAGQLDVGGLTSRELEVVERVAAGMTNREIAAELYISVRTVTSHLDHVYTKLGLGSRPALMEWFRTR